MKKLLFLLLVTANAFAYHAPENIKFSNSRGEKELVFVDFTEANSTIKYDIANKVVFAETTITLNQDTEGHIVFDLVETPMTIELNDEPTSSVLHRYQLYTVDPR